jgi:hypothetical protein
MYRRYARKIHNSLWSRVNKKKVLRRIELFTYWSMVSGIIYIHAVNNAVTQRNRTKM